MMLTLPASKVSEPLTVVRRMRSRVPESVGELPEQLVAAPIDASALIPLPTHTFDPISTNVYVPLLAVPIAAWPDGSTIKPDVAVAY